MIEHKDPMKNYWGFTDLNIDRLARSACRGHAGEMYRAYILDAIGLQDYTGIDTDAMFEYAEVTNMTVRELIAHYKEEYNEQD